MKTHELVFLLAGLSLLCAVATYLVVALLNRALAQHHLAAPAIDRSNHAGTGRQLGGLAMAPVVLLAALAISFGLAQLEAWMLALLAAYAALFVLGLLDDIYGLAIGLRFAVQLLVSFAVAWMVLRHAGANSPWPWQLVLMAAAILIAYWVNVANFMDGMNLMEVTGLGLPLFYLALLVAGTGLSFSITAYAGLFLSAALAGFAIHNRPGKTIFLGDSGSLFCGIVSAALIFQAALQLSASIAILPFLYFLLDATITLCIRLLEGKNIFRSHSEHAYQLALRSNVPASRIALAVGLNAGLNCSLSLAAFTWPNPLFELACLVLGTVATLVMIFILRTRRPRHPAGPAQA